MNDNDIKILENRVRDLENELNEITIDYLQTNATTQAKPLMRFGVYSAVVISTFDIWKQNRNIRTTRHYPSMHDCRNSHCQ